MKLPDYTPRGEILLYSIIFMEVARRLHETGGPAGWDLISAGMSVSLAAVAFFVI